MRQSQHAVIKRIRFPQNVIIRVYSAAALYIILGLATHNYFTQGYKEGHGNYFVEPALVLPFILIVFPKKHFFRRLLFSFLLIILLIIAGEMYWDYMDKPWFSPPDPRNCDGPCYGWFSFENESPLFATLLAGLVSMIAGIVIKVLAFLFQRIKALSLPKKSKT